MNLMNFFPLLKTFCYLLLFHLFCYPMKVKKWMNFLYFRNKFIFIC
ncbi:hypothetical protein RO3G_09844 [Rhizopus delemar RA 99-880]|uniref:Uncharacterized protein n=1 Tax=Rhizopus delemar (strain RA 99-880 / ATCC MYA-4621 / FGSC 9543 / NRRL 43880) TaxID=246409 RepID=I1C9K4_RHIO9|nr:hypothetical protein RO3G_09844 [Rhizopus delemar RA 99-880]|eukprot:EIE85134.1 hypothetical protein RO3G_09844 [Rhizopus delemar RA 99-880]